MYKIRERFKDYMGNEREEDFWFNLSMAELTKMELKEYGGVTGMIRTIIEKKDSKKMCDLFELLIDKSYGVRSSDGRNFRKKPEDLEDFKTTEAYSQIFFRFATNGEFAAEFINGIIPEDLANQVAALEASGELEQKLAEADIPGLNPDSVKNVVQFK